MTQSFILLCELVSSLCMPWMISVPRGADLRRGRSRAWHAGVSLDRRFLSALIRASDRAALPSQRDFSLG